MGPALSVAAAPPLRAAWRQSVSLRSAVADAEIFFFDAKLLTQLRQGALDAEVGSGSFAVEYRIRAVRGGVGDRDCAFVDVEPDVIFGRGGSVYFFHY